MINVLFLRQPSEGTSDRYELTFSEAGYNPILLPVLETAHTNISHVRDVLSRGPSSQNISGVIVTSKRSCEALKQALQLLSEEQKKTDAAGWATIPFYVVGKTTAAALDDAFLSTGMGSPEFRGESSGSAVALAPFILKDLKERPAQLLYLTGDKNRDTLLHLLSGGGISLQSLQVYETQGSSAFESSLCSILASVEDTSNWWIVYFAPSAAAYVTPILQKYFRFGKSQPSLLQAKIAAIGPTTFSFLRDSLHIHVDAMAQKPAPEELLSAIIGEQELLLNL